MPEQGRRGQRVTLREVAALAGVSLKTASRVINDEAYVAPAKREAVHLAISQLNYRPDSNASSLRRTDRRTRAVGVIVEDIANPFSSGVLRTIEESVRQRRMITIAGSMVEDLERETQIVSEISRRADALVLMSSALHHGYLETALGGNDIPIVFIDRPAIGYAADAVITNNAAGTIAAVQHLASHGHTRIAFIAGAANRYTTRERYAGYVKALGALELPVRDEYITLDRESPDAAEAAAIEQLQLPHPPTAIFAGHNLAAAGVIRALQRQRAEK